jgi:hypothetical protein
VIALIVNAAFVVAQSCRDEVFDVCAGFEAENFGVKNLASEGEACDVVGRHESDQMGEDLVWDGEKW